MNKFTYIDLISWPPTKQPLQFELCDRQEWWTPPVSYSFESGARNSRFLNISLPTNLLINLSSPSYTHLILCFLNFTLPLIYASLSSRYVISLPSSLSLSHTFFLSFFFFTLFFLIYIPYAISIWSIFFCFCFFKFLIDF